MSNDNVTICPIPIKKGSGIVCNHWLIKAAKKPEDISYFAKACVAPLINGERAFYAVHKAIAQAKHNVDIVCWGFQPSMYFIRDQQNPPIGDLLIEKSFQGVEVSIVCWSMWWDVQSSTEDNMRKGKADKLSKPIDANSNEITQEQYQYNKWWYAIVRRGCDFSEKIQENYRKDVNNTNVMQPFGIGVPAISTIVQESYILYKEISQAIANTKNQHYKKIYGNLLKLLQTPVASRNIIFATRANKSNPRAHGAYYTLKQHFILLTTNSHHQKTVLIDIHNPKRALGFVMEHNIVDNYWDDDKHKLDKFAPNEGKSVTVPWQDVSMLVTGEVLYDLYLNHLDAVYESSTLYSISEIVGYVQSISPLSAFYQYFLGHKIDNLTQALVQYSKNKNVQRSDFHYDVSEIVKNILPGNGFQLSPKVVAQILRTYPRTQETNIKKSYLKKLPQAHAYIYTENQYFRFEELVNTIKQARKNMDLDGMPWLYWFVVTNSEEGSIGPGVESTFKMMNALGRGDALPELKRQEVYKRKKLQEEPILNLQLMTKKDQLMRNRIFIRDNEKRMASLKKDIEFSDVVAEPSATKTQMLDQISEVYKVSGTTLMKGIEESQQARSKKLQVKHKQLQADNERLQAEGKQLQSEIEALEQRYKENEKFKDKVEVEKNPQILQESLEEYKMKVHICTLVSPQIYDKSSSKAGREYKLDKNSRWQEVYVHSKVTIVDDTFLTMGSANLNLRSMGDDSEINLAIDSSDVALNLRKALWKNHVMPFKQKKSANAETNTEEVTETPADLLLNDEKTIVNPDKLKQIFEDWKQILDENQELEAAHQVPQQALRRFLNSRADTGHGLNANSD